MEQRACVFFPEQRCDLKTCPALPFLRKCPLFSSASGEQPLPAVSVPAPTGRQTAPLRFWLYPAAIWLVVLLIIFLTEYAVMMALPGLVPTGSPRFLEPILDSVILIAILAPVIWWTVVRPLREVIRLRTQFLTDLFSRIETDRRGTAHELHDGVGQSLSLLVSGLRSAHESAAEPETAGRIEQLLKLSQQALKDVKRLALGLRPSLLDDLGLAPALERLAADIRENYSVQLTLDAAPVAGQRFAEPVETAAFRIAQEALANAVTHSGATAISLSVERLGGALVLTVSDNGCGFDPTHNKRERAGHLGLIGMRERAQLLGGSFAISSALGKGTRVRATIPAGG